MAIDIGCTSIELRCTGTMLWVCSNYCHWLFTLM